MQYKRWWLDTMSKQKKNSTHLSHHKKLSRKSLMFQVQVESDLRTRRGRYDTEEWTKLERTTHCERHWESDRFELFVSFLFFSLWLSQSLLSCYAIVDEGHSFDIAAESNLSWFSQFLSDRLLVQICPVWLFHADLLYLDFSYRTVRCIFDGSDGKLSHLYR